ncbi:proteasome assembly chaperone family protein [Haloarcula rubripromontorii]|uniref:Proteasome assembly chaperone family protein n=2 Tax=Haloarcula rubripromontorii TaxID=1705562 RepID=A0A847TUF4_9EURY|nr:PAC2 family protein [Haloarcula rubripromontorii]NLV06823.1 proteasome assembly chaperone family protein [Haloarcula rubripromontorii]
MAFKPPATDIRDMAHIQVHRDDIALDSPTLVEGLPGVGLVGKIAADHLVDLYDMEYYASAHCEGLPEIAVYGTDDPDVRPPVRLYADEDRDLLVLQSDAPISPSGAKEFASCMVGWFEASDATPIYLSGRPAEKDGVPGVYGISTGDGARMLEEADVNPPSENGAITGPTGALVHESQRIGLTSVGLIVEADQQFPDPEAARALLQTGISPLTDFEIDTEALVEQAEEIGRAKAQLAQQLQENQEESTSARPLGMYQ